jgi:hypothetical protein
MLQFPVIAEELGERFFCGNKLATTGRVVSR